MRLLAIAGLTLALSAASAQAATVSYTDEAAFLSAAGAGLSTDDFESSTFDGTTIDFSVGSITCSGGNFCNSFFGNQFGGGLARSGVKAPYFGTPDTLTFVFDTPVNAFGIFIGGMGDVVTNTLSFTLSDGSVFTPFVDYTNNSGTFVNNTLFFGVLTDLLILSVAITGSGFGDGVFFDDLYFRTAGANEIPIPAAGLLFGAGLAALAGARRRRKAASAA